MSNRSQNLKREVSFSEGLEEKPKAKPRQPRDGEWRSDYEAELARYFNNEYTGDAGLRSGFGYQLERQRDGVSFTGPGFVVPQPPRGIELHGPGRLEVGRVHDALCRMSVMAAEAAKERAATAAAKFKRAPSEEDILREVEAAVVEAQRELGVLAMYYKKHPTGAFTGLLGLEPFGMSAPLSAPVVKATVAWMRSQLEAELLQAANGKRASDAETEEYRKRWEVQLADVEAELSAYEVAAEDETAVVVWIARRRRLEALRDEFKQVLKQMAGPLPAVDRAAMVRRKWHRGPTYDELKAVLRHANHDQKHVQAPELREVAKRLVDDALAAARRDLGAARASYVAAREAGRRSAVSDGGKRRSAKKQAIVDAFDERHRI